MSRLVLREENEREESRRPDREVGGKDDRGEIGNAWTEQIVPD